MSDTVVCLVPQFMSFALIWDSFEVAGEEILLSISGPVQRIFAE